MEFYLSLSLEFYTIFGYFIYYNQYLYIKKKLCYYYKMLKIYKKKDLQKIQMQFNKNSIFRAKKFRKKETIIKKNNYLFIIISARDNKITFCFLFFIDTIHTYFYILFNKSFYSIRI